MAFMETNNVIWVEACSNENGPDSNVYIYEIYDAETYVAQRLRDLARGARSAAGVVAHPLTQTYNTGGQKLSATGVASTCDVGGRATKDVPKEEEETGGGPRKAEHVDRADPIVAELDDKQFEAVQHALDHRVTVISGRGGTGKTRTTKAIIQLLGKDSVRVVTYTGSCASMLSHSLGTRAYTIHAMIYGLGTVEGTTVTTLVIDEASLMSLGLFAEALRAVPASRLQRLIIVGDEKQLPAISYGTVLGDIIGGMSECTFLFRKNYRNESATIFFNADQVSDRCAARLKEDKSFRIITPAHHSKMDAQVLGLFVELKEQGFTKRDIQCIAFYNDKCTGVNALVRRHYDGIGCQAGRMDAWRYYVGDVIFWRRNDSEWSLYNGELLVIEAFSDVSQAVAVDTKSYAARLFSGWPNLGDGRVIGHNGERPWPANRVVTVASQDGITTTLWRSLCSHLCILIVYATWANCLKSLQV
jgi:hypothetical protein